MEARVYMYKQGFRGTLQILSLLSTVALTPALCSLFIFFFRVWWKRRLGTPRQPALPALRSMCTLSRNSTWTRRA